LPPAVWLRFQGSQVRKPGTRSPTADRACRDPRSLRRVLATVVRRVRRALGAGRGLRFQRGQVRELAGHDGGWGARPSTAEPRNPRSEGTRSPTADRACRDRPQPALGFSRPSWAEYVAGWVRQPDSRVSDPPRGCQARRLGSVGRAGWQPRRGPKAGWPSGCRRRSGCGSSAAGSANRAPRWPTA